jgi:hypothetical protein
MYSSTTNSSRSEVHRNRFVAKGGFGMICGATYYPGDGSQIECCAKVTFINLIT